MSLVLITLVYLTFEISIAGVTNVLRPKISASRLTRTQITTRISGRRSVPRSKGCAVWSLPGLAHLCPVAAAPWATSWGPSGCAQPPESWPMPSSLAPGSLTTSPSSTPGGSGTERGGSTSPDSEEASASVEVVSNIFQAFEMIWMAAVQEDSSSVCHRVTLNSLSTKPMNNPSQQLECKCRNQ